MQNPILGIQTAEEEASRIIEEALKKKDELISLAKKEGKMSVDSAEEGAKKEAQEMLNKKKKECANVLAEKEKIAHKNVQDLENKAKQNMDKLVKIIASNTQKKWQ